MNASWPEHINRCLYIHLFLESTFARVELFFDFFPFCHGNAGSFFCFLLCFALFCFWRDSKKHNLIPTTSPLTPGLKLEPRERFWGRACKKHKFVGLLWPPPVGMLAQYTYIIKFRLQHKKAEKHALETHVTPGPFDLPCTYASLLTVRSRQNLSYSIHLRLRVSCTTRHFVMNTQCSKKEKLHRLCNPAYIST